MGGNDRAGEREGDLIPVLEEFTLCPGDGSSHGITCHPVKLSYPDGGIKAPEETNDVSLPISRSGWRWGPGLFALLFPAGRTPPRPWHTPSCCVAAVPPPHLCRWTPAHRAAPLAGNLIDAQSAKVLLAPNEFGVLAFQPPIALGGRVFPAWDLAQSSESGSGSLNRFQSRVLPAFTAPPAPLPAFTSKEGGWHFRLLGGQIVALAVSRKYGGIKVPRSQLTRWITFRAPAFPSLPSRQLSFF